jgi:hypothetical protein
VSPQHGRALIILVTGHDVSDEARLADAGFAPNEGNSASSVPGVVDQATQLVDRRPSTYEAVVDRPGHAVIPNHRFAKRQGTRGDATPIVSPDEREREEES